MRRSFLALSLALLTGMTCLPSLSQAMPSADEENRVITRPLPPPGENHPLYIEEMARHIVSFLPNLEDRLNLSRASKFHHEIIRDLTQKDIATQLNQLAPSMKLVMDAIFGRQLNCPVKMHMHLAPLRFMYCLTGDLFKRENPPFVGSYADLSIPELDRRLAAIGAHCYTLFSGGLYFEEIEAVWDATIILPAEEITSRAIAIADCPHMPKVKDTDCKLRGDLVEHAMYMPAAELKKLETIHSCTSFREHLLNLGEWAEQE